MTVEIAIMNRNAVALAADSAVALVIGDDQRMFPSGQKLFAISPGCPVGVMIYNTASFMGIPWDTIVGMYRASLLGKTCGTLDDYGDAMLGVLRGLAPRIPQSVEEAYLRHTLGCLFHRICRRIQEDLKSRRKEIGGPIDQKLRTRIVVSDLDAALSKLSSLPSTGGQANLRRIIDRKYGDLIEEIGREVFARRRIPISKSRVAQKKLRQMGTKFLSKDTESLLATGETEALFRDADYTGLVIAGLGEHDLFPSVITVRVRGALQGALIYQRIEDMCRSVDSDRPAAFMPFAQRDVIDTFRYGIEPRYSDQIEARLQKLSRQSWGRQISSILRPFEGVQNKEKIKDKIVERTAYMVIDPWLGLRKSLKYDGLLRDARLEGFISLLPSTELAEMARSLVAFTCFYRKYTELAGQNITVAEPVKVAVISKNDGFRWVSGSEGRREHDGYGDDGGGWGVR